METFETIQAFFRRFSPIKLLPYLEATGCHPANQRFIHRFEHMTAIVLSIPENEFQHEIINHEEFRDFLLSLEEKFQSDFSGMEDVHPLPQTELVPLYFNHSTYYIFYGLMNNPVADWAHLLEMVRPNTDPPDTALNELYGEMIQHLDWQTELLQTVRSSPDFVGKAEGMYVPGASYVNELSDLMIWTEELPGSSISPGVFSDWNERQLLEHAGMVFEHLGCRQVKISDRYFRLYSQTAFNYFQRAYVNILQDNPQLYADLSVSFTERLEHLCLQMFRGHRRIARILADPSHDDIFGGTGMNFNFDGNKIFVFCAVHHEPATPLYEQLQKARERLEDFQTRISVLDTIAMVIGKNFAGLVADKLEWIVVYVTESIHEYELELVSTTSGFRLSWAVDMGCLTQIFSELKTPLELYKFIEEENWLHANYRLSQGSGIMERFNYFITEGRSYARFAYIPNMTCNFNEMDWGRYIHDKLYKRNNENADLYKSICSHYDNHFDRIKRYNSSVYLLTSSVFFQSIYVVDLPGFFVPIWLPEDPSEVAPDAYSIGFDVLATMFADYIGMMGEDFTSLLEATGASKYGLVIYPVEYFKAKKKVAVPQEILDSLSEENPLVIYSVFRKRVHLVSYILYDYRHSYALFDGDSNVGERNLLQRLLESIAAHSPGYNRDTITNMVDTALPEGQKGYAVDHLSIANFEIPQYDNPSKATRTDRGRVHRLIADFLKTSNIQPGVYTDTKAKELVYTVYQFMQRQLEQEIVRYNQWIIIHAYQQLEFNEGKIERDKVRTGMHVDRRRNYDIKDSNVRDYNLRTRLVSSTRYLLHTAIKVQPAGEQIITECDWCYLMAMAEQMIQLGISWSYCEYKLQKISIKITDMFEYVDSVMPGTMDFDRYQFKEAEERIRYSKELFDEAAGKKTEKPDEESGIALTKEEIDSLLAAFESSYGIDFILIIETISVLSRADYELPREFPLYITSKKSVCDVLLDNMKGVTEDQANAVIDFLTLIQDDFKDKQFLYHEILFKQQKRLTLCPLVQLADGKLLFGREVIDGCNSGWKDLLRGRLAFEVDAATPVAKQMELIRHRNGRTLEEMSENIAKKILGKKYAEARIKNFKRLSKDFASKEPCGEIDLLCVNPNNKTVYVFDCKCLVRKIGLYHTHRNIQDFFEPGKGYHSQLLKKKQFVNNNLGRILGHFGLADTGGWSITEAFVVNTTQYAEFSGQCTTRFIRINEFDSYLRQT